jgi:hypothetical protein
MTKIIPQNSKNEPPWEEDGNSPLDASGAQSHTYTLADEFDEVAIIFDIIDNNSGAQQDISLRLNGDTGANYFFTDESGTRTSSAASIGLASGIQTNQPVTGSLFIDGRFTNLCKVDATGIRVSDDRTLAQHGVNNAISSPINTFTIRGTGGNIAVKARVYGLEI